MNFLALDVETANADFSSICQIGIAEFNNGEVVDRWETLINPKTYFDDFNIEIHGITKKDVKGAPTFKEIYKELGSRINGRVTIHHTPFDRVAISRACSGIGLDDLTPIWVDSAKIVRRTWDEFSKSGYGLGNITDHLGIEFDHHNALQDAIATGKVVVEASRIKGVEIEEWITIIKQRVSAAQVIGQSGDPDGELYGETIVFTGALSMSRQEAAKMAAELGCDVGQSVTKKTTILVVGIQGDHKLAGYQKSSKHRKAEVLILRGIPIKILSENDFINLRN